MQFVIFCITYILAQPMWQPKFQTDFHEVNKEGLIKYKTQGTLYYDYANLQYRIDRENGRGDRYCGTTHAKNTPCSHYVKEGKRYLHFPNLGQCCFCCDSEHGCGVLRPDWAADSEFVENVIDEEGRTVEKWDKKGLQSNFIYQTIDTKMNTQIDQLPNNFIYFILSTYSMNVEASVFELPDTCNEAPNCGGLSICGRLRQYDQ